MTEPDYIVLRPGESLQTWVVIPETLDGYWYDKSVIPPSFDVIEVEGLIARPTNQFETRDDGAVAEIWEVNIK